MNSNLVRGGPAAWKVREPAGCSGGGRAVAETEDSLAAAVLMRRSLMPLPPPADLLTTAC